MSYSFSIAAASKTEAKQKIADSFDGVVTSQPVHRADRDAAVMCGQTFVDMLADPDDGKEILVNMSGSMGWRDMEQKQFTSAGVNVNAYLRDKAK